MIQVGRHPTCQRAQSKYINIKLIFKDTPPCYFTDKQSRTQLNGFPAKRSCLTRGNSGVSELQSEVDRETSIENNERQRGLRRPHLPASIQSLNNTHHELPDPQDPRDSYLQTTGRTLACIHHRIPASAPFENLPASVGVLSIVIPKQVQVSTSTSTEQSGTTTASKYRGQHIENWGAHNVCGKTSKPKHYDPYARKGTLQ